LTLGVWSIVEGKAVVVLLSYYHLYPFRFWDHHCMRIEWPNPSHLKRLLDIGFCIGFGTCFFVKRKKLAVADSHVCYKIEILDHFFVCFVKETKQTEIKRLQEVC